MNSDKKYILALYVIGGLLFLFPFTMPLGVIILINAFCRDHEIQ